MEPKFSVFYQGSSMLDFTQAVLTMMMHGHSSFRPWEWGNKESLQPPEIRELSKEIKGVKKSRAWLLFVHACNIGL